MQGKIRLRLAMMAALATVVAVLVPATLAIGADGDPVTGEPSIILLKLGPTNEITWETETQAITTKRNKCKPVSLGSDPQLLVATPTNGDLGYNDAGLGVAGQGEGNSGKCAQVNADAMEGLSIALGTELSGYAMNAVDLDLELKFDASIRVSYLLDGDEVASDLFDGVGADDGPDSADGDNYRYNSVDRGIDALFDEVDFVPENGAFTLETGADGTEDGALANNAYSQFQVVPVYDGEITCGVDNGITIHDAAFSDSSATVVMRSLNLDMSGWDSLCEELKPYNDAVASDSLSFLPDDPASPARYTMTLAAENQVITSDPSAPGAITSLSMQYSALGDFTDLETLQACNGQPSLDEASAGYASFWEQSPELLVGPSTYLFPDEGAGRATACFYDVDVQPTGVNGLGETVGTEVWRIVFEADPSFRFK